MREATAVHQSTPVPMVIIVPYENCDFYELDSRQRRLLPESKRINFVFWLQLFPYADDAVCGTASFIAALTCASDTPKCLLYLQYARKLDEFVVLAEVSHI